MRLTAWMLLALGALGAGCSDMEAALDDAGGRDTEDFLGPEFVAGEDFTYQIDVVPAGPTDGSAMLLPQSFSVATESATGLELSLRSPVTVAGTLTAYVPTPLAMNPLPGRVEPVDAEVSLLIERSAQSRYGTTDASGAFALRAVPGSTYDLTIRPRRPDVPFVVQALDVQADVQADLFVDLGLAVWGRVLDDRGAPIPGVSVHAESAAGIAGWADVTDADGWYQLRVLPGLYSVVSTGRASGRDPTIRSPMTFLSDADVRVDLAYDDLDLVAVGGRATTGGSGVAAARVRFIAESLDGYPPSATHEVEALTNGSGTFDTRLVPGTYTVEVLPALDAPLTPLVLPGVAVTRDVELGDLALLPHRSVSGTVIDDGADAALVGATVRCTEDVGDRRSWSTSTDALGAYTLPLPQTAVICVALPPGDRRDLAMQRQEIDLAAEPSLSFRLGTGVPVDGRVRLDNGDPAAFALVQILDSKGTLWGTALTDGDGGFTVRVAWPAQESTP